MTQKFEYISNENLKTACEKVISAIGSGISKADTNPYKNIIDPFSAVFEASYNSISLSEWMTREKQRQAQKSWQNSIGTFHQDLIGYMAGFQDLGAGGVLDVKNDTLKIIVEVKNKFNTTKGNHNIAVYDDIKEMISRPEYADYKGYYVKILTKKRMDKCFTPSDNKTKTKRPSNKQIREIDGKSFYTLITGDESAMVKLYKAITKTILEILETGDSSEMLNEELFNTLFNKAFS